MAEIKKSKETSIKLETVLNKNGSPETRAIIEVAYYSNPIYIKEQDLVEIVDQLERLKTKIKNTVL